MRISTHAIVGIAIAPCFCWIDRGDGSSCTITALQPPQPFGRLPNAKCGIPSSSTSTATATIITTVPTHLLSPSSSNTGVKVKAIAIPTAEDVLTETTAAVDTATLIPTPILQPPQQKQSSPSSSRKTKTSRSLPYEPQPVEVVSPADAWVTTLDYAAFGNDVAELGKALIQDSGDDDVQHLNKMVRWRDAFGLIGLATLWMTPNPITVIALSTWIFSSWAMIAHHTCHGGYNRMDTSGSFRSKGFAIGSVKQRVKDWLDWMHPEAWNIEHNRLHHYRLNEASDPDLVQRNLQWLRDSSMPPPLKFVSVFVLASIWKWSYYAPNTWKELEIARWKKEGKSLPEGFNPSESITVSSILGSSPEAAVAREIVQPVDLFARVLGPFFVTRFVLLPALFLLVPGSGPTLMSHAVINMVLADVLTNLHSFLTIVTNHAGEDLYTFDDAVKPKSPSFYVRQIVGSANYQLGSDPVDFFHGFLNYQIEHHVWPDLSMLQYQKAAPQLKAICEKHGVPYIEESVWTRLRKTVDIMVGRTTMRRFPVQYEPAKDKATRQGDIMWQTTNGAIHGEEAGV